jgi:hypothetical protein
MSIHKKVPVIKTAKKQQVNIPYHYKPETLSLEDWQRALRRQFIEKKYFSIEKNDNTKSPYQQEGARFAFEAGRSLNADEMGLAKTLSTKDGAEQLAHSLVEKDEKTGKTHLKIPVENEETVSNVLNMLGNLFKGLGK